MYVYWFQRTDVSGGWVLGETDDGVKGRFWEKDISFSIYIYLVYIFTIILLNNGSFGFGGKNVVLVCFSLKLSDLFLLNVVLQKAWSIEFSNFVSGDDNY